MVDGFTLTAATGVIAGKALLGPVCHGQSFCKSTEALQKQPTWFFIAQRTMSVGLHNEVLLAVLQHFVLPALSPLLAISPSFPTEILRGLNQLSVVCQSVSNSLQFRKTIYSLLFFLFHAHQSNIYVSVKYILLFLIKALYFSALQQEENTSTIPATGIKPAMTSS